MKKLLLVGVAALLLVGAIETVVIAQGQNNSEIAGHLVISPKTVRNHISNIFSKLRVADRAQAIVRARQAGLG